MSTPPTISVIITSLFSADLTARCVRTLKRHTPDHDLDIVVINGSHGPGDDTAALSRAVSGEARVIGLGVNHSFAEANAIGVEAASGEFLVFLNNDAFVTPGWLEPMLATLTPSVGAVAPKLVDPDGRLQEVGAWITGEGHAMAFGRETPPDPADLTLQRPVPYASAACLLMRKDVFLQIGGFSRRYEPAYYEDADLCLTLTHAELKVVCAPQATVVHLRNQTSVGAGVFGLSSLHTVTETNRHRFLSVWGAQLRGEDGPFPSVIQTAQERNNTAPTPGSGGQRPSIVVQLPEPLTVASRTRAQLTAAMALADEADVTLLTAFPYSLARVGWLCDMLGIPRFTATQIDERAFTPRQPIDAFITCENKPERLLTLPAARRIHVLPDHEPPQQEDAVPLHWPATHPIAGHCTVASSPALSDLWRRYGEAEGWTLPPTRIIGRLFDRDLQASVGEENAPGQQVPKPLRIVAVGRFSSEPGRQRFDRLIEAARLLHDWGVTFSLTCIGAIDSSDSGREAFHALVARAHGLPVSFLPDLQRVLYLDGLRADLVWHAPDDDTLLPLGVLDAIAAGCRPVVLSPYASAMLPAGMHHVSDFIGLAELTRTLAMSDITDASNLPDVSVPIDICPWLGREAFAEAWRSAVHD